MAYDSIACVVCNHGHTYPPPLPSISRLPSLPPSLSLAPIFRNAINAASVLTGAERTTLWIVDRETRRLWSSVAESNGDNLKLEVKFGPDSIVGLAFQEQQIVLVNDTYDPADRYHK